MCLRNSELYHFLLLRAEKKTQAPCPVGLWAQKDEIAFKLRQHIRRRCRTLLLPLDNHGAGHEIMESFLLVGERGKKKADSEGKCGDEF